MTGSRFDFGRILATPGALERAEQHGINLDALLTRHARRDWGDLDPQDWNANDIALETGARLFSAYGHGPEKLWVITEAATDVCPACHGYGGTCEPTKGSWDGGSHYRDDRPSRRLTTTILCPEDY